MARIDWAAIERGWRLNFDKGIMTLRPEPDELIQKINDAAKELSSRIAKAEQTWMLKSLGDESLEKLIALCNSELSERKRLREKLNKELSKAAEGAET